MGYDMKLMTLSEYGQTPEVIEDLISYVCFNVLTEEPTARNVTVYMTQQFPSTLFDNVPTHGRGPGYLVILFDTSIDMLYYMAAMLQADGFVHVAGYTPPTEPIYVVWTRHGGLTGYVKPDAGQMTALGDGAVIDFLPPSLRDVDPPAMH